MSTAGFDTSSAPSSRQPVGAGPVVRHDWAADEVRALYELPLIELVYRAQTVHRATFPDGAVQLCQLLSVKTGGCSEDCAYCPQAARYHTGVEAQPLLPVDQVLAEARAARDAGASRFCMGAAWRKVRDGKAFDQVIDMVRGVRELGMEACCTLGMLTEHQAQRLAEAGLTAYNHNLDTSPEYYGDIISTRTYADRLQTLEHVRNAGINVCCGGIVGLGESVADRCGMLAVLANQPEHPESVPINALVAVEGTPLAEQKPVDPMVMVRMVATARLIMPHAKVRLSAGRLAMSDEAQVLCFMAGANSIFFGEKLLTTGNPSWDADKSLLERTGIPTC